jgi:hypothetical protein
MPVLAQSQTVVNNWLTGNFGTDPAGGGTVQSQNLASFPQASGATDYQTIVVTAEATSNAAGVAGAGATFGDQFFGEKWLGTNSRLYQGPRGNQHFFTFLKLGTIFKVTGVGALTVGTFADYYTAQQTGSYSQANFNLGLGLLGIAVPPFAIPASAYGVASMLFPGGQAAYNQAYSDAVNAAEGGSQ